MTTTFNKEFSLDPALIYLNHAAVAPWPVRTQQAVMEFAAENANRGAQQYDRWLGKERELRCQLQQLINAPSIQDIALQKNTSEGLSIIAYGLSWQKGDEIVITNQEFPSNRIVWESLAQFGVKVIEADITQGDPEQAIINSLTERTRLVSVSSVQYGTGIRLNLTVIGQACQANGCLFCVDAIQSLGAYPFDVQQIQADFVVADGHKWMLGPEGLALLYVAEPARDQLKVLQYGWHMVDQPGQYDRKNWNVARSAQRYECGSPNMLGIHALSASLSLLLETGIDRVAAQIDKNCQRVIDHLVQMKDIELLSPVELGRRAGIVTFRHRTRRAEEIYKHLKEQQVICALRGGGIRFSPHFYTPEAQLEKAIEWLE